MPETDQTLANEYPFLRGGGELGQLTRSFDWAANPIGITEHWPQSLRTTLGIILHSAFPQFLFWGNELICFYNDAFRPSLGITGKHPAIGKRGKEVWPEIWDFIGPLIKQVMETGEPVWYEDQLVPFYRNGKIEEIYWTFSYSPAYGDNGNINGVYVTCTETTDKVLAQKRLTESEGNLRLIINQAPVAIAIFRGLDYIVEVANPRALELWGRREVEVLNKPILECMPELKDQGIKELLDHVYKTGEPFAATELPVELLRNGQNETAYINFVYEALYSADGLINGLITIGFEITDQVIARKALEKSETEQFSLNEELTAANEELTATNEELAATQKYLQQIINDLAASESRFRFLVQGAPVAIGVLTGRELVIESANDMILKIWGKTQLVLGEPLDIALPELKGQPYLQLLDDVYTSGEAYYGTEAMVMLEHNGKLQDMYFNFIYQPLGGGKRDKNTIMVVAVDVTEQVFARMELERAEEMLRFSVEAAGAATWFMDAETREFVVSPRLKEIFGFQPDVIVGYDDILQQIAEEYHEQINKTIARAIAKGEGYTMEHPITGIDGKNRWVRALGKLYPAAGSRKAHFSGLIIDITEQKLDELRKNDFIGMVSHELKTPLTSLTALVQVLNAKLKNSDDQFIAGALDKANVQVKKMSNMINGFLNISRLESGKIVVDKQLFELNELINEIISETELSVTSHTIGFSLGEPLLIYADRDKIGSVISNLLSNAVKYSPKGKVIAVKLEKNNDNVVVSIKDEGMGVKPQDLDKLFDRYYRVESKHTTNISGFGIGLYLSAEIINRHDGKIRVESESGKGSTFYFELPL